MNTDELGELFADTINTWFDESATGLHVDACYYDYDLRGIFVELRDNATRDLMQVVLNVTEVRE